MLPNLQKTPLLPTSVHSLFYDWSQHSLHYNACLYNIWVKTEAIDLELPRLLEPWLTQWNPAPQVMALESRVSPLGAGQLIPIVAEHPVLSAKYSLGHGLA